MQAPAGSRTAVDDDLRPVAGPASAPDLVHRIGYRPVVHTCAGRGVQWCAPGIVLGIGIGSGREQYFNDSRIRATVAAGTMQPIRAAQLCPDTLTGDPTGHDAATQARAPAVCRTLGPRVKSANAQEIGTQLRIERLL